MHELHPSIRGDEFKERVQTRRFLATMLSAIVAGRKPEQPPSQIADRLAEDPHTRKGDAAWGLEQGLRALAKAIEWEPAVEEAVSDSSRFPRAAQHIAAKALQEEKRGAWSEQLVQALEILAGLNAFEDVRRSALLLDRCPIPASVTNLLEPLEPRSAVNPPIVNVEETPPPSVLLHFTLDDMPVSWPMALNPCRAYQISALVTVEKWPADAERLIIEFESDVPPSVIERNSIVVTRGEQMGTAYLVPKVEIDPNHSVQLTPTVFFQTSNRECCPASVVGQRSLRVTTFDPSTLGSGQPLVAQRIIELLGELDARIPTLPRQDRLNLIHLLDATARFTALANERADLRGLDELNFQAKLKQAFVQDRFIGRRIQEAPKLGGGITDLLLERIVVELKIDHTGIDIDSVGQYGRQPTQYAAASDCPISMLIILDDSPKSEPPGVQSNYMRWAYPKLHGVSRPAVSSMVAAVLIPIGFPVPSEWSRKKGAVGHGE
jgi:hypothetical protein